MERPHIYQSEIGSEKNEQTFKYNKDNFAPASCKYTQVFEHVHGNFLREWNVFFPVKNRQDQISSVNKLTSMNSRQRINKL